MNSKTLIEFTRYPSIGPAIAKDLIMLGYHRIEELKDADPEILYQQLQDRSQKKVCRCMLYVFRYIVYLATEKETKPELMNWWAWKD